MGLVVVGFAFGHFMCLLLSLDKRVTDLKLLQGPLDATCVSFCSEKLA